MFVTVDPQARKPIYRQIGDQIKGLMARGELPSGTVLPSVRQLAGDLGVNFNTVALAYRELEEEGLVRIQHGRGVEVCNHRPRPQPLDDDRLRAHLRDVLTGMRLADKSEREVRDWLDEEIRRLWR
jgi:GntR family transcriptional regulator